MPPWMRWLLWRAHRAERALDRVHRALEDGQTPPPRPRWLPRCTPTEPWTEQ